MKKISKVEKQVTMGMINEKVNELAKKILPESVFEKFVNGELAHRVLMIGIFAENNGEKKVSQACQEWLEVIMA